jgi:hypothetical protein
VAAFTPDQWLILALAFLLGLILGMAFLASPKWKKRYRDEVARREALETENRQLRKDAAEMDSLRQAAARDEARHRDGETARRDTAEAETLHEAAARDEARLRDAELARRDAAETERLRDEARRRDDTTA